MKKAGIVLIFMLVGIISFAQSKHTFSFYFGKADDMKYPTLTGDWQSPNQSYSVEVAYSHAVYRQISIETGIRYSEHEIETKFNAEPWLPAVYGKLHLMSIPVRLKVSFLKFFFCNAGLTYDIDFNRDKLYPLEDQSGIGYELGIGFKVNIKKLNFSINPIFRKHSFMAFKQGMNKTNLIEIGYKFGIGYSF